MKSLVSLTAVVASLGVSSLSSAAILYTAGTETGSRYNAQANTPPTNTPPFTQANAITFTNCVFTGGNTSAVIERLTFGIRQLAGAPSVDLRFFVGQMAGDGSLVTSSVQDIGTASVAASAAAATTLVNFTLSSPVKLLMNDLAPSGNAGLSGFFVGLRFEGANAANGSNGWRITNAPAVGLAFNRFGLYDPTTSAAGFFAFNAPTPSYMYVNVEGSLIPAPGALALLGVAGLAGSRRRR